MRVLTRLTPFLSFDGNAREAMDFYHGVFGGSLVRSTYGDLGGGKERADRVMHAVLETATGLVLMASDQAPGTARREGNAVALSLSGDNAPELRGFWERLADGGRVTAPLEVQSWGDELGTCVDRFGVSWVVSIASAPI